MLIIKMNFTFFVTTKNKINKAHQAADEDKVWSSKREKTVAVERKL